MAPQPLIFPAGVIHKRHARPVTTCEQAAELKGIPLAQELKTMVLKTTDGPVLCHLPGDRQVCLRKVKRLLQTEEACLASAAELAGLGVEAGTVCPFRPALQVLRAILDPAVLEWPVVSTNDGTRFGAVFFNPALLPGLSEVRIADCTFVPEPP